MTIASCINCPNSEAIDLADATNRGALGCKAISKVVHVGGISPQGHLEELASICPSAGVEVKATPVVFSAMKVTPVTDFPADDLSTCRQCAHFIEDNYVHAPSDLSFCGATGAIIAPEESYKDCSWAKQGFASGQPADLHEHIVLAEKLISDEDRAALEAKKILEGADSIKLLVGPEPAEYPSDLPVEDHHKGIIRAWRGVEVGDGSKRREEYIPIYDPEFFTEDQRDLIPVTGSDEHPELYHDGAGVLENFVIESYLNDEPLCLIGEPGTGKTEGARYIAWLLQAPFTLLPITEETLPDEYLGHPAYDPSRGTYFKEGRLPKAWQAPGVICTDELNTSQESIKQAYRTANGPSATIFLEGADEGTKIAIKRHPHCFHLMTLNPSWDARNIGAREMADPDVQRLSFLWVEEPDEATIAAIIRTKLAAEELTISDEELVGMLKVRKDIKELARSGALPFSWSIRQDIKVAKKMVYRDPVTAYKRALLDYCHPDASETVIKAVQSVFGF